MSQHVLQVGLRELCCSWWVRPQTWRGPAPAAASSPAEPRTTQWMFRHLPITQRNQGCSNYSCLCRAPVCRDAPQRLQGAVSGMRAPPSKRQKEGFWPEPPCLLVGGMEQAQTTNSPHPVRRKEESSHSPGRKGQDKQGHDTRSRWARRPRMRTTQPRGHRAAEACGAEQQDPGLKTQPCVPPGAGQAALQPQEFCALVSGGRRPSLDAKAGHLLSGKMHSPSERTRPQDNRVWETGLRRKGLPGWHGLPALCPLVPATCAGSRVG